LKKYDNVMYVGRMFCSHPENHVTKNQLQELYQNLSKDTSRVNLLSRVGGVMMILRTIITRNIHAAIRCFAVTDAGLRPNVL
jgi:hypothetical protein